MAVEDFTIDDAKKVWDTVKSKVKWGLAGLVALNVAWSSWYVVPTGYEGVEKRLGAYAETTDEGPHGKIPLFIESVTKVPVTNIHTESFGFRTLEPGIDSRYIGEKEIREGSASAESMEDLVKTSDVIGLSGKLEDRARNVLQSEYLMLTGDLNMADIEWIVQWHVKDSRAYLFNVEDPVKTLRDASLAGMRGIIGNNSFDEAIIIGRADNEVLAKANLQKLMDNYGTGMAIDVVRFQSTNPPHAARAAFNKVNEAQQEKETKINEAKQAYNKGVPEAIGTAEGVIKNAEGYAIRVVNEAQGDSAKFMEQWTEYRKAPTITKERMYLEAMENAIPRAGEVIIIDDKGLGNGILNVLGMEGKK